MTTKYAVSPDFEQLDQLMQPILTNDPNAFPMFIAEGLKAWNGNVTDDKIKVTKYEIPSIDDEMIEVQVMELADKSDNQAPCLVYYHGGGWILPVLGFHIGLMREYIMRTSCKVVCVNYRIAPQHPFPVPFKDCYQTLLWVEANAAKIGIDTDRIVVGGDSAGGTLSTTVAMMARDNNGPRIAGQMLIYPATDARLNTESMVTFTDTPVWNGPITNVCYGLYLKNGDCGMREYVSPIEAESLAGLPQAYVEVAEFDPLRDEGINYAKALKAAGVSTRLNQTKSTTHAFDYIPGSPIIEDSLIKRAEFLNESFLSK